MTASAALQEFSLDEARAVLRALQALAPNALRAPLSFEDMEAVVLAGIVFKSRDPVLLDFPTTVGDVPAYWCWRSGEAEIEWWHSRDEGFVGRQRTAG